MTIASAQGTTVSTIQTMCSEERRNAIAGPRSGDRFGGSGARDQRIGESTEVFVDLGAGRKLGRQGPPTLGGALSGQPQVGLAADRHAGLQIAQAVAYHRHALEVDAETLPDLLEQPGQGLAAMTAIVRAVRAIKHRIDAAALG